MSERAFETDADLMGHLKDTVGRELRTREDVRRYLKEISEKRPERSPVTELWHIARQSMWLLLLVSAYLQYYFLDILVEIDSLPSIQVTVPVPMQEITPPSRV